MSRNRDLANIIAGGFTVDDLPTLTETQIPNLSASKITSGTFADARISASNVSQHATSFDDNKIVNDISTLAIRQASNENKGAYNTNSMFVDVFQDSTGIASNTNAPRSADEYVSTVVVESFGTLATMTSANWNIGSLSSTSFGNGTMTHGTSPDEDGMGQTNGASSEISFPANTPFQFSFVGSNSTGHAPFVNFQSTSNAPTGNPSNTSTFTTGGRKTNNSFQFIMDSSNNGHQFREINSSGSETLISSGTVFDGATTLMSRDTNGTVRLYKNGSLISTSSVQVTDAMIIAMGGTGGNASSASSVQYSVGTASLANATGNFTGTTITAPSSVSSMGAIITYQDQSGTNALNTDIVLKLSADNGSNYSTATLTALPDFSTGIKMAKVNDLSVTAGTSLKYKIEFANQASGSKEARIRGVSLQY